MARVDFPDSPSNGATITANGITYIYDLAKGVWRDNATAGIASDNPPANPVEGQMWFNSTEAALYFYYNDGSSAQWVGVSGPAGQAGEDGPSGITPSVHMGSSPPSSPDSGGMWYDTETNDFSLYYKDGTSNQWVTVSGPKGDDGADATLSSINQSIIPDTDSAYDLGSPTNKFRSLYLSSSTLYLGDSGTISATSEGEIVLPSLKIGTGANAVKLSSNASGELETTSVIGGSAQSATKPGTALIFADMAALIAHTGMTTGETALITSLNKLFMYTGTGWFLIATMVNDSPTAITGVDGSYTLATDGTATTVTVASTDPEGFPLTFSHTVTAGSLTNGGGATATVTQGTGANTNVFTITPSTTEAYAGTFSLTFSVTDGATGAVNAVSAFTLAFSAPNSRYTALSVRATNTGSNQTFDDASTSNHTITVAGDYNDITASTFSPYRHGGYSAYFDGSGDALNLNGDAEFAFGTNDFTVEFWVYLITGGTTTVFCDFRGGSGNGAYTTLYLHTDNTVKYLHENLARITSSAISINAWNHIALTRSGNYAKLFINGQQEGSTFTNSSTQLVGTNGPSFGQTDAGQFPLNGYMSDIRILNGTAAYTSNFTPPTEPLTAITNTKFLLGRLPYFKDQSASNHAITINGNVSLEPKSVFDNAPYTEASHGSSAHCDGSSGDSLTIAGNSDFAFGTGDFSISCWIYFRDLTGGYESIIDARNANDDTGAWQLGINSNAGNALKIMFSIQSSGTAMTPILISNTDTIINQWYYISVSRTGTTSKLHLNGTEVASNASDSTNYSVVPASIHAGSTWSGGHRLNGYLSDIRVVKGTGLSDYTAPTAPLTAVTNTKFLLNPETSISDLSQKNALICRGNLETSTTQVKFAGTKSIYFAGSDDYIHVPNSGTNSVFSLNSTKFTIEGWFYKETNGNWDVIISKYRWANNLGWSFDHLSGGNFRFRYSTDGSNSTDLTSSLSSQLLTGSWAHVALVANNNLKLYINGVGEVLSASALPAFYDTNYDVLIGALRNDNTDNNDGAKIMEYNGWMQDLRIHNNHAQYTANFTPPTAELEG